MDQVKEWMRGTVGMSGRVVGQRSLMAHLKLLLVGLSFAVVAPLALAQKTKATAPNLTMAGLHLNLSQTDCINRARAALTAAGLDLHTPTGSAYGGNDADVFAIITCEPCGDRNIVTVSVAGAPDRGDTFGKAVFLRNYMLNGQAPGNSGTGITGGTGMGNESLLGSWRGCDGRVVQFTKEGNEFIGRYTALGGLGVFKIGDIGYRARSVGNGRYEGQVQWRWTDGRSEWKPNTITIKDGQYTDTGSDGCSQQMTNAGGTGTTGSTGTSGGVAGGICSDPRTLVIMDEWLGRAQPPQNQQTGWAVRYEAWGRLVGKSATAQLTVTGPPDTRMTRCEWLWHYAADLRSTNIGTLKEYVERRW